MKELFGVDVTENKKNDFPDGVSYETRKISSALSARIDALTEKSDDVEDAASLPNALKWVQYACGVAAGFVIAGILRNTGKLSLKEMYGNAAWLFWIGGACALVFLTLLVMGAVRRRNTEDSAEYEDLTASADSLEREMLLELGVPEDAASIDGLAYQYKTRDGENKIVEQLVGHYIETPCYAFCEKGCFCLCDSAARFDIPLGDIHGIYIENKKRYMTGWSKDKGFYEEPYKEFCYKNADNLDRIWLRSTCLMEFALGGEEFRFRFPTYELETVERLCGIKGESL